MESLEVSDQQRRILFVSAVDLHVAMTCKALEPHGDKYDLTIASSVEEACDRVSGSDFDLIILDSELTEDCGREIIESVPSSHAVPLVLLSRNGDNSTLSEPWVTDVITKSHRAFTDLPRTVDSVIKEWNHLLKSRDLLDSARRTERLLSALVSGSRDAIIIRSAAEDEVVDMNPVAENLIGLSRADALGKSLDDLLPEDAVRAITSADSAVLRKLTSSGISDRKIAGARGITRILCGKTTPVFDDQHRVEALITTLQDRTNLRKLEDERLKIAAHLQSSQRLETAAVLSACLVHDLCNFMATIQCYADLLKTNAAISLEDMDSVREISVAADSAFELAKRLGDTFAPGSDTNENLDICELVKKTLSLAGVMAPRHVDIEYRAEDEPLFVEADPTSLRQVILNISNNAFQEMFDSGGVLRVVVSKLPSGDDLLNPLLNSHTDSVDFATIEFEDTGRGIHEDILDMIFEPFFTTRNSDRGSGLGLYISRCIITSLGGDIVVKSAAGSGASFRVLLPLSRGKIEGGSSDDPSSQVEFDVASTINCTNE
jgi:PAS domain S-box-containing protein